MEPWTGKLDLLMDQLSDAVKESKDVYCIRKDIHDLLAEHVEGQYDEGYEDGYDEGEDDARRKWYDRGFEDAKAQYAKSDNKAAPVPPSKGVMS